ECVRAEEQNDRQPAGLSQGIHGLFQQIQISPELVGHLVLRQMSEPIKHYSTSFHPSSPAKVGPSDKLPLTRIKCPPKRSPSLYQKSKLPSASAVIDCNSSAARNCSALSGFSPSWSHLP